MVFRYDSINKEFHSSDFNYLSIRILFRCIFTFVDRLGIFNNFHIVMCSMEREREREGMAKERKNQTFFHASCKQMQPK